MAFWVAVIVTLFATAIGKPQYLASTNGVVTPHYYQQPLTYLYPGMAHRTYFHANPFFVPHTYPANFASSSVVHYPKAQPYWFLNHCSKLTEKMEELFNLVDANSDRKVTLAEFRDDTLNDDPRVIAIEKEVFANFLGDTTESQPQSADDEKYTEGLERPLFAKNDVNKDNSLNVIEFSNVIGDMFDVAIFFAPYDTNHDGYLDKDEFDDKWFQTGAKISEFEAYLGSTDGKLSAVELLTIMSIANNVDPGSDICARRKAEPFLSLQWKNLG